MEWCGVRWCGVVRCGWFCVVGIVWHVYLELLCCVYMYIYISKRRDGRTLVRAGPRRRGICLMSESEARKALYLAHLGGLFVLGQGMMRI